MMMMMLVPVDWVADLLWRQPGSERGGEVSSIGCVESRVRVSVEQGW